MDQGARNDWLAVAAWRETDPEPQPGQTITVHRKDGTTSTHTITGVRTRAYENRGRLRFLCEVD